MSIKIPNAERPESAVMTDTTQDKGSVSDSPGSAGDRHDITESIASWPATDASPKRFLQNAYPGQRRFFKSLKMKEKILSIICLPLTAWNFPGHATQISTMLVSTLAATGRAQTYRPSDRHHGNGCRRRISTSYAAGLIVIKFFLMCKESDTSGRRNRCSNIDLFCTAAN